MGSFVRPRLVCSAQITATLTIILQAHVGNCLVTDRIVVSLDTGGTGAPILATNTGGKSELLKKAVQELHRATILQESESRNQTAYLAVCLAVKNQHKDIREWVEYHHFVGVSKFYIYDEQSELPLEIILHDYISKSLVEYRYIRKSDFEDYEQPFQMYVYNHCLRYHGRNHTWMAYLDADDYVVIKDESTSVPDVLKNYEHYGALGVNWVLFSSSGHEKRPSGSVFANYHKCLPLSDNRNSLIKTFVNTKKVIMNSYLKPGKNKMMVWDAWLNGHSMREPIARNKYTVDENFNPINGSKTLHASYKHLAIHHYGVRSLEELEHKLDKGTTMAAYKTYELQKEIEQDAVDNCTDPMPETFRFTVQMWQFSKLHKNSTDGDKSNV